jgi:putative riboflavin transport system substrate-binding protein
MKRQLTSLVLILVLLLPSCTSGQATPAALTKIRLPMGFIPNVQFAPFYVAVDKGYFRQSGLEIEFDYKSETDGVSLVGAGNLSFTVASGEQVLLARDQGIPVVFVLAWWQKYPVAVTSLATSGILTPTDLKSKKIGLPGLFGASYIGLRALLSVAGLNEEDVTLDSIGYTQVEALVNGLDEAVVVYAVNEPTQLAAKGYQVNTILVSDYVQLASNGLVTNEDTIAKNPDLVLRMNQAVIKGIRFAIDHPDETFEICKKYIEDLGTLAPSDLAVQKQILMNAIEFWKAGTIGKSDPQAWENMLKVLLDMKLLSQPLDLSKAYTNQYIGE